MKYLQLTVKTRFITLCIQLQEINSLILKSENLNELYYYDKDSNKIEPMKLLFVGNIGSFRENMVLNRVVNIKTDPSSYLSIYSHLLWQDIK